MLVNDQLGDQIADPAQYHCEYAVPVFRPHKRFVTDPTTGLPTDELKYEVKDEDLQEICDLTNAAIENSFHYPRHTIGHTVTADIPEVTQPSRLVGVSKNFRVAHFPKGGKCIVADLYTKARYVEALEDFPYRSSEYNFKKKQIRGVARILRDPALELGTYTYDDRGGDVANSKPEDDKKKVLDQKQPKFGDKPEGGKNGTQKPGDDKAQSERGRIKMIFGDLNPDEVVAAERLVGYLEAKYPKLGEMLDEAVGEVPDQITPPSDNGNGREAAEAEAAEAEAKKLSDEANGGGKKSQTNKSLPNGEDDEDSMPANKEPSELEKLQAENQKLKVARILDRLETVENLSFDRAEAEIVMLGRDEAGMERYAESIRKHSQKRPGRPADQIEVLQDGALKDYLEHNADPISVSPGKMTYEQYQDQMAVIELDFKPTDTSEARANIWKTRLLQSKMKK